MSMCSKLDRVVTYHEGLFTYNVTKPIYYVVLDYVAKLIHFH